MTRHDFTPPAHNGQLSLETKILIILGELTEQGQRWFTKEDILTVRAAVDLRATITGVIIPQGTIGKVLQVDSGGLIVCFGLSTVHRLPIDTDLIHPLDTPVIEVE